MIETSTIYLLLSGIALLFATMWTATNFYNYYPVAQSGVLSIINRVPTSSVYARQTIQDLDRIPTVDVLIPAYSEGNVIHQSITSVCEASYPNKELRVHVVLEPSDTETREAVDKLSDQHDFNIITVPKEYPGTPNKPRALNYAYEVTDGDIIGVIDAENIVDNQLFDRAAAAIVGSDLDYVQGLVDMVNEDDGWLNLLFRAEYGFWYRVIVPRFQRLGFPIPLSGTTCFFKRSALEQVSVLRYERRDTIWSESERECLSERGLTGAVPWDPLNVTEDFELGLFLWAKDFEFGLIDVVTYEESPRSAKNWLEQRTRWQKGKLYTFVQFFRTPIGSQDKMTHILWQSFLPHLGPMNILAVGFLILIGWTIGFIPELTLVVVVLILSLIFFIVGIAAFASGYWITSTKSVGSRLFRLMIICLTLPVYWFIQWIADVRASKKLIIGDLDWEQTIHHDYARFDEIRSTEKKQGESVRGLLWGYLSREPWIFPILGLAFLLRLPDLSRSLWVDEIYSVSVRGSLDIVPLLITNDPHPPMYYLLLNGWMTLFGTSVLSVRSLSVVIGLTTVLAGYLFANELFDRSTGLLTALFMSVSVLYIQYSQTARMYSLLVLFSLFSLYFYVRLLDENTLETRFGYGIMTLFMILTHIYGWFILFAQIAHLAVQFVNKKHDVPVRKWAKYQGTVIGFALPWMAVIVLPNYIFADNEGTVGWITQPDLLLLRDIFLFFGGVPINYPKISINSITIFSGIVLLILFSGFLLYLVGKTVDSEQFDWRITLLITILVMTVFVPFIISLTAFPMLATRYAIVGGIPFSVILARGITIIDSRTIRVAFVVIVVSASVVNAGAYYQTSPEEDWESLGQTFNEEDLSNDLVVFIPEWTDDSVIYYTDESFSESDTHRYDNESGLQSAIADENYERIWLVSYGEAYLEGTPEAISSEGYQETDRTYFGQPVLIEYNPEQSEESLTGDTSPQTTRDPLQFELMEVEQ